MNCICLTGEFGSVREAFLKMEDGTVQKVAVKVLKSECFHTTHISSICHIQSTIHSIHSL